MQVICGAVAVCAEAGSGAPAESVARSAFLCIVLRSDGREGFECC
jgi:hypothetical protein